MLRKEHLRSFLARNTEMLGRGLFIWSPPPVYKWLLGEGGPVLKKSFYLIVFISCQLGFAESNKTDTVTMGVYLNDIYDIDFPENELKVDLYVWYKYKNPELKLQKDIELVNAKEYTISFPTEEINNGVVYATQKYQATVKKNWNILCFPFDKHQVKICFESTDYDRSMLVAVPDVQQSNYNKDIQILGWLIKNFKVETTDYLWETSFGAIADTSHATYSRFVVSFDIERKYGGFTLFIKCFIGLFIAVMLSFITFRIDPRQVDPRFGLSVGAIFGSFANQYVVSSMLPETAELTLVDLLHDISYVYIFISVFLSVISLRLMLNNRERASKRLDNIALACLSATYLVVVTLLVKHQF